MPPYQDLDLGVATQVAQEATGPGRREQSEGVEVQDDFLNDTSGTKY